ncbi:MAG: histidinol-phosphatase HisJ family protein [Actinomycetota bacterium]|nr:histidinol-phosphatase HisJ family protein [Actinomycetota bacterium]
MDLRGIPSVSHYLLSSIIMETNGLVDYHLHTYRCGHADGCLEDYIGGALRLGLSEIGFSDHFPMLDIQDTTLAMSLEEVPDYVKEARELDDRFGDLEIKLGIEVDYLPETVDRLAPLLGENDFDYILGSIHFVDGWGFDDPRYLDGYRGCDLYRLWSRYFELLAEASECGLFDVLAHPDLIKKFGYRPEEDVTELYISCLDRVAATGVAVEVNTAGLRKPVGEIYPGKEFLLLCREREIPVTLGSDAHSPGEVGAGFEEALGLLRRVGYSELVLFRERKRASMPLP